MILAHFRRADRLLDEFFKFSDFTKLGQVSLLHPCLLLDSLSVQPPVFLA